MPFFFFRGLLRRGNHMLYFKGRMYFCLLLLNKLMTTQITWLKAPERC